MSLPGGIDAYFQLLYNILANSSVIKSQEVFAEKRTLTEGFVRANVLFTDDSLLHFRELVTTEPTVQRISYTYHYQRTDGTIVFRYDDALIFQVCRTHRIINTSRKTMLFRQILPIYRVC